MISETTVTKHLAAIEKMTASELRTKYAELFGETSRSGNRQWLARRCAWRVQAQAEGDLSARAKRRASELARDYDLRLQAPPEMNMPPAAPAAPEAPQKTVRAYLRPPLDARLPLPGMEITRWYKGRPHVVEVMDRGFGHEGKIYRSLSAVAYAITGNHWNGYLFFKIAEPRKETA